MALRNYIVIPIACLLLAGGLDLLAFKKPSKKRRRKAYVVFAFVLTFLLAAEAALFPGLKSLLPTGKYTVASTEFQMNDMSREEPYLSDGSCRKLLVSAYYPENGGIAPGSCPLVVFSHGAISNKDSNISLFSELASHGYVIVSIDHTYQCLSTTIDGKKIRIDRGYLRELQNEDSHQDIANSVSCYKKWMAIRTADINFVIDSSKAQGVARQRDDIKAVVALEAPYLCDITGYDGDQFTWDTSPYRCAILNIYSDSGFPLIGTDNKYDQNENDLINEGMVEYCYIQGSNHYTLTDLVRVSPIACEILGGAYTTPGWESLSAVNENCLAFLNTYLRQG